MLQKGFFLDWLIWYAWAVRNWLSACWQSWEPSRFPVQVAECPGKSRSGAEGLEDFWRATGLQSETLVSVSTEWSVHSPAKPWKRSYFSVSGHTGRCCPLWATFFLPSSVNPSRNYLPTSPTGVALGCRLPSDFLKLTIRISYHNSYCSWNLSGFEESRRRFIVLNKNAMLWNLCKISYDFQNHTGSTVMAGAVYQLHGIWNRLGVCVCV